MWMIKQGLFNLLFSKTQNFQVMLSFWKIEKGNSFYRTCENKTKNEYISHVYT